MHDLIEYVRTLAEEIGPRPATTDAEHRAAEWLATTFGSYGLETEMQEFEAPRTYSWAYVLYHLLTLASAVVSGPAVWGGRLVWPAVAVSAITAFFLWSDLDTHWGLTRMMPKGPSQNVIARHIPRARRGERLRRIVIVAHYDSARSSLAFAPKMVGGFVTTFGLMKWCTYLTPLFVLAAGMPFTRGWQPWLWYVTMAISAYLVVPLLINVHRELFMPFVAGANDNASGVAAMLGVMERLVPAPDASSLVTGSFPQLRRDADTAISAGVVPDGAEIDYGASTGDAATELPSDFKWAEPVGDLPQATSAEAARPAARPSGAILDFETIEFAAVEERTARRREQAQEPAEKPEERDPVSDPGILPADVAGPGADELGGPTQKRGLFGGLGSRRKERRRTEDVSDWLGVDEDFSATKTGREIGSWDNFEAEEEDPDGFGWKGGWAGDDPIEDPEFAANEAARIRRRVTESVDRELTEKEIWFVATGAEETGTWGMQAFLREHGDDLRDALIINIDGCGAGQLHWASGEGMARRFRANQRLVGLARRVSRETEIVIKPRIYRGLSTDATPALARGFKAISIMAFNNKGLPVNWHWHTDEIDEIDEKLLLTTTEFVTAMVREA